MSSGFLIYADNEPKSVPARDLGDCRDNLRNLRSVFLIVGRAYSFGLNASSSKYKSCSWVFTQFNNLKMRDIASI